MAAKSAALPALTLLLLAPEASRAGSGESARLADGAFLLGGMSVEGVVVRCAEWDLVAKGLRRTVVAIRSLGGRWIVRR